jgi:hypothetical protein
LPAAHFVAAEARLAAKLPVQSVGALVEFEGKVSSVSASPPSAVVRGVTVGLAGLAAGSTLPAVGDVVRVLGTIAADGSSVAATSVLIVHVGAAATLGLEGELASVATAATSATYTFSILGKTVAVNARTHLTDRALPRSQRSAGAFNINTFQSYIAASASKHAIVEAELDSGGAATARSVTLIPESTVVAVAGLVDATPAPVNGSASGAATMFDVRGIAVSANAAAVIKRRGVAATVAAGDAVIVRGTFAGSMITVAAPSSTALDPNSDNVVFDLGTRAADCEGGL